MSKRWFLILTPMSGSCMLTIIRSICRASTRHAQPPAQGTGPGYCLYSPTPTLAPYAWSRDSPAPRSRTRALRSRASEQCWSCGVTPGPGSPGFGV